MSLIGTRMDSHDEKLGVVGIEDLPRSMKRNLRRFFKDKEKEKERMSRSVRNIKFNEDLISILKPVDDLDESIVYQMIKAQEKEKYRRLNRNPDFIYQFTKVDEENENTRLNHKLDLLRRLTRTDQGEVDSDIIKLDQDLLSKAVTENKTRIIDHRVSVLSKMDEEKKKTRKNFDISSLVGSRIRKKKRSKIHYRSRTNNKNNNNRLN